MKDHYFRTGLIVSLILLGSMSRLIPHPPNFTAVAAMGLFGGYYLRSIKGSLLAVLLSMLVSDAVIRFHGLMPVVYLALGLSVLIGWGFKDSRKSMALVAGGLAAAGSFFVITNFAVWLAGDLYPRSAMGLATCYVAAIPFFRNELAGTLVYGGLLFGILQVAERLAPSLQPDRIHAK